jgi:tRNA (mo5U34)-methyltransferase
MITNGSTNGRWNAMVCWSIITSLTPWNASTDSRRDIVAPMSGLTLEQKRALVASRSDWFHSIDVGDRIITPGTTPLPYQEFIWETMRLPEDMRGLRVLDIGTYDGFFAFEAEKRGAEVVAIDLHPVDGRCFALAHRLRGSRVVYHQMSLYDLDQEKLGGTFDVVLCLGVYYHLRHLFVALDNLWAIARGEIRLETHVIDQKFLLADGTATRLEDLDARLADTPIYRFYRFNEAGDDYSNWFGGNIAAVMESLSSAGFTPELLGTWNDRALFKALKNPETPREWEKGSYEGTRFTFNADGTWTSHWIDPWKAGMPDRWPRK